MKTKKRRRRRYGPARPPVASRKPVQPEGELEAQWGPLSRCCSDRTSLARLSRIIHRLSSRDRGTYASAWAELDVAAQLLGAGCRVRFLPESQSRTADLECHHRNSRFFVEVTAMVGSGKGRLHSISRRRCQIEDGMDSGTLLIDRIIARIFQKARQLADYCDPVILAITIPEVKSDDVVSRGSKRPEVNLQQLGGMVTVSLPMIRQLSAVFLSLWNVEPAEARTGIRLANVFLVERPGHQTVFPRVRLLILNPAAGHPLRRDEIDTFKKLL